MVPGGAMRMGPGLNYWWEGKRGKEEGTQWLVTKSCYIVNNMY